MRHPIPRLLRLTAAVLTLPAAAGAAERLTVTATHSLDIARPSETIAIAWSRVNAALPHALIQRIVVKDGAGHVLPYQVTNIAPGSQGPRARWRGLWRAAVPARLQGRREVGQLHGREVGHVCRPSPPRYRRASCPSASTTSPGRTTSWRTAPTAQPWPPRRRPARTRKCSRPAAWTSGSSACPIRSSTAGTTRATTTITPTKAKASTCTTSAPASAPAAPASGTARLASASTSRAGRSSPTARCAIFELAYEDWDAAGTRVAEVKRFTVDAGHYFDRIDSSFTFSGTRTLQAAVGLNRTPANQGEEARVTFSEEKSTRTLVQWVAQKRSGDFGVAVIMPAASGYGSDARNSFMLAPAVSGQPLRYYVGAAWTRAGEIASEQQWKRAVADAAARIAAPLTLSLSTAP
jgi:hypothetical protein